MTKPDSPRKRYYLSHIERCLEQARLGPRQRERVMSVGWSKVRHYCHLLDRENYETWTKFADDNPVETVQLAALRGKPRIPQREKVRTLVFRLPVRVRDQLINVLREHYDWQFEPVQRRGKPNRARDGDEKAVSRLLRDAKRGRDR